MAGTALIEYETELLKMIRQPTLELGLLSLHWQNVEKQIKQEQLELARKIPADDPIRLPINLFAPIGRTLDETLHTRVLSYLLDDKASHGFRKNALAALVEKIKHTSRPNKEAAEFLALLRQKRTKVAVTPEYRYRVEDFNRSVARCDIWIELHSAKIDALLIIENKINAPEAKDQLKWYEQKARTWSKQHPKSIEPILIFLTLDKRESKSASSSWLTLSYIELAAALRKVWLKAEDGFGREWLALYIASITGGVLGIEHNKLGRAALSDIETYLCQ
jgi:hypothetical protein